MWSHFWIVGSNIWASKELEKNEKGQIANLDIQQWTAIKSYTATRGGACEKDAI